MTGTPWDSGQLKVGLMHCVGIHTLQCYQRSISNHWPCWSIKLCYPLHSLYNFGHIFVSRKGRNMPPKRYILLTWYYLTQLGTPKIDPTKNWLVLEKERMFSNAINYHHTYHTHHFNRSGILPPANDFVLTHWQNRCNMYTK